MSIMVLSWHSHLRFRSLKETPHLVLDSLLLSMVQAMAIGRYFSSGELDQTRTVFSYEHGQRVMFSRDAAFSQLHSVVFNLFPGEEQALFVWVNTLLLFNHFLQLKHGIIARMLRCERTSGIVSGPLIPNLVASK